MEHNNAKGGIQTFTDTLPRILGLAGAGEIINAYFVHSSSAKFINRYFTKFKNLCALFKVLKLAKPDVAIAVEWDPCGYLIEFLKAIFGFKSAAIVHGQEIYRTGGGYKGRVKRFIRDWTFNRSDAIVAVSTYTAKRLEEEGIKRPMRIIWNGYDEKKFSNIKRCRDFFEDDKIKLVTLSRVVERKGHLYALKALQILIESGRDISYDIIGDGGYKKDLELYVKKNNLENHVNFHGILPDEAIRRIFSYSDIFIHPNYAANGGRDFEGFGIVLLEAMSAGLPVMAGRNGGPADIIKHEDNGILVEGQDPIEIADAILRLKNDRVLINSILSKTRKTLSYFSSPEIAKKYEALLLCE